MSSIATFPCVPCVIEGNYTINQQCQRLDSGACSFCGNAEYCTDIPLEFQENANAMLEALAKYEAGLSTVIKQRWRREFEKLLKQLRMSLGVWFKVELERRSEVKRKQEEERRRAEAEERKRLEEEERRMNEERELQELRNLERLMELSGKHLKKPLVTTIDAPGIENKLADVATKLDNLAAVVQQQTDALTAYTKLMYDIYYQDNRCDGGEQQPVFNDNGKRDREEEVENGQEEKRRRREDDGHAEDVSGDVAMNLVNN